MTFYYDYVCEPSHFRIIAEKADATSKGIKLRFIIGDKEALVLSHNLKVYVPSRKDIDDHIARCCSFIKQTSENYIQDRIDERYVMGALGFHRHLKKVSTKTGRVIWKSKTY